MNPPPEDFDVTFGLKPDVKETDSDLIFEAAHEHQFVTKRIALGSAIHNAKDIERLRASRITHVVDCTSKVGPDEPNFYMRQERAPVLLREAGIAFLHCPTDDDGELKSDSFFRPGVEFAVRALRASLDHRCLIHCWAGQNRGPGMVFALLLTLGMSPSDAEAAIRAARPYIGVRYFKHAERWFREEWSR